MQGESRIEKIASGVSEVVGLSFLLGLTVAVCGYAGIRDALERTFDKRRYWERKKEGERILNEYVSALRQIGGETQQEREERQFCEYLGRQGVRFN